MNLPSRLAPAPLVDWGKAIASMFIVWHHLCFYGPMARAAGTVAPSLVDWLADPARQAVQVFLVIGGFLAARSLMPHPGRLGQTDWADLPSLLVQRFGRLMRPAWPVLLLVIVCAALARSLMDDIDTPAAPTLLQFIANALLLHDIVGQPALSAGLWYLAIDLQLFAVLALLTAILGSSGMRGASLARVAWSSLAWLIAVALWVWNRDPEMDMWALYFVGSYGLGVAAHWIQVSPQKWLTRSGLLLLVAVGLWLEWRSRLALAVVVAFWLSGGWGGAWLARSPAHATVRWLSRISYCVFLVHYAISLVVNALFSQLENAPAALAWIGLLSTWALSVMAGHLLHHHIEVSGHRPATKPATAVSAG